MTILDRANAFIGHEQEVDEGYETTMRRNAFIAGFKECVDAACDRLKNVTVTYNTRLFGEIEERAFDDDFIAEFRELLEGK